MNTKESFLLNKNSPASDFQPASTVTEGTGVSPLLKIKDLAQKRPKRHILILSLLASDALAIVTAFILAEWLRFGFVDPDKMLNILLAMVPIYVGISLNNKAYQASVFMNYWTMVNRSLQALFMAASAILLILFFFKVSDEFSRIMFAIGTALAVLFIGGLRVTIFRISRAYLGKTPYADLCIYDDVPIIDEDSKGAILAADYQLEAAPHSVDAVSRLGLLISGMDCVIVHCKPEKREAWVFMLRALDIKSEIVVPELNNIDPLMIKKRNSQISLLISDGRLRWDQQLVKRAFDLILGSVFALMALPFLLITAVAIKLESRGPIFFKQERIGLGNRSFHIYKFRSMRTEMADAGGDKLTEHNDPRVTAVGRFIRRTSIDEMPQLINVLGGSMSLVGPRPHPRLAKAGKSLYWEVEQSYWHRHCVKPGITGLAQVTGHRGNTFVEDDLRNRLNADLKYVSDWSLLNDIKILFKTIVVLRHPNAF